MLHPAIYLSEENSIEGQGLFTSAPIAEGEVVWGRDNTMMPVLLGDVQQWSQEKQDEFFRYAFQCAADAFILLEGIDRYMNHSCDPNTWWLDDATLVASRPIANGEEVTYDYATTEISIPYRMTCRCGAANCRGVVTELDFMAPAWQQRYGNRLPSFVLEAIAQSRDDDR